MITLKEIARQCGCSIRTVNRVLRHDGPVAEATRQKIEELVHALHYIPNMAARNLRQERRNCVGVVMNWQPDMEIHLRKQADLLSRLEVRGFYPLLCCNDNRPGWLEQVFAEWAGLVRHVFFVMPSVGQLANLLAICERFDFSYTVLDAALGSSVGYDRKALLDAGISMLGIDRTKGIFQAIRRLVAAGHRHIARCGFIDTRDDAWKMARGQWGAIVDFSQFPFSEEQMLAPEATDRILDSQADAVFFDNDRMAHHFYRQAAKRGIQLHGRFSIIGIDNDPADEIIYPALSSLSHPVESLNAAAAEIAAGKMASPVNLSFNMLFVERESFIKKKE